MAYEQWDVALARFPFAEIDRNKLRPVIVLSNEEYHRHGDLTIVAMITSASQTRWWIDYPIVDVAAAGLVKPCVARFKLATLAAPLMGRRIGSIGTADRVGISQALATILPSGLSPPA